MKHGWRTQFIIISCFLGPILVLAFFLMPEHVYNREDIYNTDVASEENLNVLNDRMAKEEVTDGEEKKFADEVATEKKIKKTWIQELKVYNGRYSDESFWKCLLSPFVLMLYPATIWSFLLQGTFITWVRSLSQLLDSELTVLNRVLVFPSSSPSFLPARLRTSVPPNWGTCTPHPSSGLYSPSSPLPSSPTKSLSSCPAAITPSTSLSSVSSLSFRPQSVLFLVFSHSDTLPLQNTIFTMWSHQFATGCSPMLLS